MANSNCKISSITFDFEWNVETDLKKYVGLSMESKEFSFLNGNKLKLILQVSSAMCQKLFIQNTGSSETINNTARLACSDLGNHFIVQREFGQLCIETLELTFLSELKLERYFQENNINIRLTFDMNYEESKFSLVPVSEANSLVSALAEELENPQVQDWTIICKEKKFPCNTTVLSLRSAYFARMFSHTEFVENQARESEVTSFEPEIVEAMLRFMYTDQFNPSGIDVLSLMKAAHMYMIPLLQEKCTEYLQTSITVENAVGCFHLSLQHNLQDLKVFASRCISENIHLVRATPEWAIIKSDPNTLEELVLAMSSGKDTASTLVTQPWPV